MPDPPVESTSLEAGPLVGVPTSVAVFVGFVPGEPSGPHRVLSAEDFVEAFGGLQAGNPVSDAVHQFFLNGGHEAWVVGVAAPAGRSSAGDADVLIEALATVDAVDLVNLLCIPDTDGLDVPDASRVAVAAAHYATARRAFYLLDPPTKTVEGPDATGLTEWLTSVSGLARENVAVYTPRPLVANPLDGDRLRSVPASGTIAGLFARVDAQRGVWKTPAGLEAVLRGVAGLERAMTDAESNELTRHGINSLRSFQAAGAVCWGARTLAGAAGATSDWAYVPARRLALFLEESIARATPLAVREPSGEPRWSRVRLAVSAFLHELFRKGAFQGATPREAFFVKCDRQTTTQEDLDRGVVNVIVGFAPMRPAEFVLLTIRLGTSSSGNRAEINSFER